jgi:hypothetical protein
MSKTTPKAKPRKSYITTPAEPIAAEPTPADRGLQCPRCRSTDWKVTATRPQINMILRKRECQKCGFVCSTREKI